MSYVTTVVKKERGLDYDTPRVLRKALERMSNDEREELVRKDRAELETIRARAALLEYELACISIYPAACERRARFRARCKAEGRLTKKEERERVARLEVGEVSEAGNLE